MILAFDLDGTLAQSKSPIDEQMKSLLVKLLFSNRVCVISGGKIEQFKEQLIGPLIPTCDGFERLHLFPTSGTSYYTVGENGDLKNVYKNDLEDDEVSVIFRVFNEAFVQTGYYEPTTFGDVLEERGSQVTFSALGQEAPYELKKGWDPTRSRRHEILDIMRPLLPDFDVRLGGTTSIDVTRRGMDKGFAVEMIEKYLHCKREDILFFGDALEPGGNDHAVYKAGVPCVPVADHIDCVWKVKLHTK